MISHFHLLDTATTLLIDYPRLLLIQSAAPIINLLTSWARLLSILEFNTSRSLSYFCIDFNVFRPSAPTTNKNQQPGHKNSSRRPTIIDDIILTISFIFVKIRYYIRFIRITLDWPKQSFETYPGLAVVFSFSRFQPLVLVIEREAIYSLYSPRAIYFIFHLLNVILTTTVSLSLGWKVL